MKNILFIVPYPPQGASNRFRVLQFLPGLEKEGIGARVRPFYSQALWRILYREGKVFRKLLLGLGCAVNRLLDLWRALAYDMVFIHRESFPVGPAWFERCLRLLGKPYIYDFDDAVFLPNAARSNRLFARLKCPGKTAAVVRMSSLTIAGNSYLADFARRSGAGRVEIVPTVVNTEVFRPARSRSAQEAVVVGWIGSATTIDFLAPFIDIWQRVIERIPEARLRIVGGSLPEPWPAGVECVAWSMDTEVSELQRFDIGIMPMPDNQWTRGKCAFKAIEYMAAGVPAVCSPVGMNLDLITHGKTGFLPGDENEWTETIIRLAGDPELRSAVGTAGRSVIEENFSLQAVQPRLLRIIREAAG
ncbi:MAG: glycosyltransferase family 4 protein [Candidatus Glassbacteria bacterium]|nr:glycosyltransferase family 4 protein [Candidatus Glassbacteria bacterium]